MSDNENNLDKYLNQSLNIDLAEELKYLYKFFDFNLPDTFCAIPRAYFVALKRLHKPLISTSALDILNEFFVPGNRDEAQEVADSLRETSNVLKAYYSSIPQGFTIWETNETFLDRWVNSIKPSKQEFAENRIRDLLNRRVSDEEIEKFIIEYPRMSKPKELKAWYLHHVIKDYRDEITLKDLVDNVNDAREALGLLTWKYDTIQKSLIR